LTNTSRPHIKKAASPEAHKNLDESSLSEKQKEESSKNNLKKFKGKTKEEKGMCVVCSQR